MSHAKKVRGSYGGGGLGTPAADREMGISLTGQACMTSLEPWNLVHSGAKQPGKRRGGKCKDGAGSGFIL